MVESISSKKAEYLIRAAILELDRKKAIGDFFDQTKNLLLDYGLPDEIELDFVSTPFVKLQNSICDIGLRVSGKFLKDQQTEACVEGVVNEPKKPTYIYFFGLSESGTLLGDKKHPTLEQLTEAKSHLDLIKQLLEKNFSNYRKPIRVDNW